MVQYSMKMHQIVTTRLNNLQYHSLLRLNSIDTKPCAYCYCWYKTMRLPHGIVDKDNEIHTPS